MPPEEIVFVLFRIAGSLFVFAWPFAGALIAMATDFSDLFLMDALGGIRNYQVLDKWCDQVYLGAFLLVALRWPRPQRLTAIVLSSYRLIGFVLFELTHVREVLVAFPNVFEFWFVLVAGRTHFPPRLAAFAANDRVVLLPLLVVKEIQEFALHWF